MSDNKKINIKITADVSKFKSSMDNANKQVKKFKTETKTAGNTKLDNVTKQVDKINNKTKQLNNTTKNTTKNFKNVNSVKLGNATKQVDKINRKVSETSKKTADSTKKITSLKDKINSIKDKALSGVSKTMSSLRDKATGANSSTGKLKDSISNLTGIFSAFKSGNFSEAFSRISSASLPIPGNVKAIIASVTILVGALKKLYEAGKQRFFEGLTDMKNDFSPITNAITSLGSAVKTTFESITEFSLSLQGLATAGINFETQMNKVQQLSGATGNQLEQLSDKAKYLGSTSRFQAYQIGQGFEYMSMAGWNASEMLSGINSVVNLSILSGQSLASCSDIVTDDLTALGLEANQASDFVDKLASTITRSNTNVELYGYALTQCGAQAGTLGVNVTDLNTAIGLMANAGVKGSKAGMSLKNMLANMAAPTDKMEAALKKLGMTADETGSYLKTTADGNVDLAATCKTLMSAMNGMEKSQKVALLTAIVGKNAAPGILAMLSQGEGAWNELSDSIENSTSTVQFWNENMSIMGKKGNEARKIIDNFKDVYDSVEERATDLGFSTKDLALSIQVLGADGKVTKKNMSDLLDVFESMDSATGKSAVKWRELGGAMKNTKSEIVKNVKSGYDYDSTISKIDSDTSGLTQKQKKQIESQINANMTYKEANKILKKYGLSADHVSLSSLNTSQKLEYLRETTKGLSDDQRKAALKSLGLSDSFDEVTEVCRMSDKDFKKYQKNLETIEGLSSKMAKAMDSDTKGSLLSLASAIEGKAIQVFEKLKGSIKGASNTLAEFFGAWQNQGLEKALLGGYKDSDGGIASGLVKSVQNAAKQIPQAIQNAISSAKGFITGGSMQGILDIGTSIVHGICQGIINSYQSGDLTSAISGFIQNICNWIIQNGADIKNAVKALMSSAKEAITENQDLIRQATDTLFQVVNEYIVGKKDVMWTLGAEVGPSLIGGLISGVTAEIPNAASAIGSAIGSALRGAFESLPSQIGNLLNFDSIMSLWIGPAQKWGIDIGTNLIAGIGQGLGIPNISGMIDNAVKGIIDWFKNLFGIHSPSTVMAEEVGQYLITGLGQGIIEHIGDFFSMLGGLKDQVVGFFKGLFTENDDSAFKNLDASQVTKLDKALQGLNKTAQSCKNNLSTTFNGLRDSIKNSFVSCSNIARNQFVNISNIVRNQSTNARNSATSQFISLKKVISTQLSEARNIATTKMMSLAKVVNTQSLNARNNATRNFISLRKVIQTQMAQAYSSVSSYMNKIAHATNRTLNTKVNVTKTTTTVTKKVAQNASSAFMSLNSAAKGQAFGYAMATNSYGYSEGKQSNSNKDSKAIYLQIPVLLDGKVVAKATAQYMDGELKNVRNKNSRKRGTK